MVPGKAFLLGVILLISFLILPGDYCHSANKIYVAFHWHMHQPIYWPYESISGKPET